MIFVQDLVMNWIINLLPIFIKSESQLCLWQTTGTLFYNLRSAIFNTYILMLLFAFSVKKPTLSKATLVSLSIHSEIYK